MPKGAREEWIDEPFPETAGLPCVDHPMTVGDGTGSLDDEEAPYAPALIVNGISIFNFFAKFLGDIRVYGLARVGSLISSGMARIAASYLQFTAMTDAPAWTTLPSSASGGNIYVKGKKLIVQANQSNTEGAVRYWYLDLDSDSPEWRHGDSEAGDVATCHVGTDAPADVYTGRLWLDTDA